MASKPPVEYATPGYIHSPDREILTQEGCQALLQIGEKTIREYRRRKPEEHPIPYVEASNTFRYPRAEVIKWFAEEAQRPKELPPD